MTHLLVDNMQDESLYWWCDSCCVRVPVLIGYDIGVFCGYCGTTVRRPDDIPDPDFYDMAEEETKV